jgi:hypothetical protein
MVTPQAYSPVEDDCQGFTSCSFMSPQIQSPSGRTSAMD